ncbi:hypothetical protein Hanom_Chr12g01095111 [Helianthus anomalus]
MAPPRAVCGGAIGRYSPVWRYVAYHYQWFKDSPFLSASKPNIKSHRVGNFSTVKWITLVVFYPPNWSTGV